MKRKPSARYIIPSLPDRLRVPDDNAIAELVALAATPQGKKDARALADFLERAIEVYAHNTQVARETLRLVRAATGEVQP